jgi:hypothetical protein
VARRWAHLRVCVSAASGLSSCTRATAEGWREGARTTGRRSSERALGRVRVSSEMRRDDVGYRTPSGVGPTRWNLLSGRIHWHSTSRPVVECGRDVSFGRRRSQRNRLRSSLRGQPEVGRMEPDRAETPCLPPTFGLGDAKAVRAARRNVQRELGGAIRAAASEKRVDPKPKGASSGRATATSHERNGLLGGRRP